MQKLVVGKIGSALMEVVRSVVGGMDFDDRVTRVYSRGQLTTVYSVVLLAFYFKEQIMYIFVRPKIK